MTQKANKDFANFCYNIAWLREQHGLSKRKMAEILGIGIQSLNKLESGIMPPQMGVGVLFAVQDYFGASPKEMLTKRLGEDVSLCGGDKLPSA